MQGNLIDLEKVITTYATADYKDGFFNEKRPRNRCATVVWNAVSKSWSELSAEEKDKAGKTRAESHNKIIKHTASFNENLSVFQDFVYFCNDRGINLLLTAMPASSQYLKYLTPEYKNIFDLYLKDSTTEPTQLSSKTGDDSTSEFSLGEAVFYQNGTWAWSDLQKAGMKADSVGMIPIYIGAKGEEKQGLATGSENYWCINSKASDADKKATKDFLKWVVTSKTGIKSLSSDMGFTTPFKSFSDVKSDNPLVQAAVDDQNSGKTAVSWNFTMMPSEEWKNKLGSALLEYAQGTGDWDAVKTAFVDGWKTEYDAVH